MEKKKSLYTVGADVNWCSHCWKCRKIPKKTENTIWPSNFIPGYISEGNKNIDSKRYVYPSVHINIIYWKSLKSPSTDKWMKKLWDVYRVDLASSRKEWNFAICNNVDGPAGYYSQWNKSDRKRQILYVTIYMWNLKN